jgi:hypothetical protein
VETSEEAKVVLKLPPLFATLKKLKSEEIETEVEKGMSKLRMHIRNENEPDVPKESVEPKPNGIDLTNLRVTDLPFCTRIYLSAPLDTKMDIKIQRLRDKFINKAEIYIRNNTVKGKVIKNNLSKKKFTIRLKRMVLCLNQTKQVNLVYMIQKITKNV